MEPIPEIGPLRLGQPALHRLVHARTSCPAAFFVGTLASISSGSGWWPGVLAIIVGNVIGAGARRRSCRRWARGPAWPRSRRRDCRSASRSSLPGILNWLSTIAWDAHQRLLRRVCHRRCSPAARSRSRSALADRRRRARPPSSIVGYEAIHTFERYAAVGLGDPLRDRDGRPLPARRTQLADGCTASTASARSSS